jgi:SAM-dependent methyltransferase
VDREIEAFYNRGGSPVFRELLRLVNRQAVTPFFRRRSGDGSFAGALGLSGAVHVDLARDQLDRCRERIGSGFYLQADLEHLPFRANCFDQVICSNVLHYTGVAGMEEIVRVTKPRGKMLVSFLEGSVFTRIAIAWGVCWGFLPPLLAAARLVDLAVFMRLGFQVEESATVAFIPPLFEARRELPRLGFVAFELEKPEKD